MRGIPSSCHLNILCSLTRGQLLIDSIHSLTCLQRHISETWVKVQAQRHCVDRGQRIAAARGKGFFSPVIFLKETWLKHLCWIPSGSEQGIPGFISRTLKLMDKIWTFYWGKGALLTSTWPLVCPRNHCYLRAPGLGLARSNSQQRAGAGGCLAGQYKWHKAQPAMGELLTERQMLSCRQYIFILSGICQKQRGQVWTGWRGIFSLCSFGTGFLSADVFMALRP